MNMRLMVEEDVEFRNNKFRMERLDGHAGREII